MLEIKNLCVSSKNGTPILEQVSFSLEQGKCLGLTGASGSGKTTLIKTIMGIQTAGLTITGEILLDKVDLLHKSSREKRACCGRVFGFVPQNPMTAFWHQAKISTQLIETFRLNLKLDKQSAANLAMHMLHKVNLTDTQRIMNSYPGQLSGGMLQRITMAVILGTQPRYIFADEPTSALDNKNRDHLLRLLKEYKGDGILFISHDVYAMKQFCPDTSVMENGRIIETQKTDRIFSSPIQPWTRKFAQAASCLEGGDPACRL